MITKGTKVVLAILVAISVIWIVISVGGLFLYIYITSPPTFTSEQCEVVKQNFNKLKVGMTKEQVIPLMGGERRVRITLNPGNFPGEQPGEYLSEQKTPWEVWALCNNLNKRYE